MITELPKVKAVFAQVGLAASYAENISQGKADLLLKLKSPSLDNVKGILFGAEPAPKPKPKSKEPKTKE